MHEFGIAQDLLTTVLAKAHDARAARIDRIKLEIGVLSGVEDEALTFAFTALAEGTKAERAELTIDKVPLRCHCAACGRAFACEPSAYRCPDCGTVSHAIVSGKEMNLVAMEVT